MYSTMFVSVVPMVFSDGELKKNRKRILLPVNSARHAADIPPSGSTAAPTSWLPSPAAMLVEPMQVATVDDLPRMWSSQAASGFCAEK
jgi:hypothetical protein